MMRLVGLRVENFRSLRDGSIGCLSEGGGTDLPDTVLFYGKNDVGKSNLLKAIDVFFSVARAWILEDPTRALVLDELAEDRSTGTEADGWLEPPIDSTFFQGNQGDIGTASFSMTGVLEVRSHLEAPGNPVTQGTESTRWTLTFQARREKRIERGVAPYTRVVATLHQLDVERISAGSSELERAELLQPVAAEETNGSERIEWARKLLPALKRELEHPWVRVSAERRWQRESHPMGGPAFGWRVPADGRDLKTRLFRAIAGTSPEPRMRIRERFEPLVQGEPFQLPSPHPVMNADQTLDLLLDERPFGERGSGPQQWLLMAGMIAMSDAAVIGLEEPELNMSWHAQQEISRRLLELVADSRRPYQLFVASHSPVMYLVKGEGDWWNVEKVQGATVVTRKAGKRELMDLMPTLFEKTQPASDRDSILLYPDRFLQLDEKVVDHLGAQTGDWIFWKYLAHGAVQIWGPTYDRYLDDEPGEGGAGNE